MGLVLVFALAGGMAQFVDGTLGMGFGVTSATVLLWLGASPVAASAATHIAKLPTTFASGISHWRAGNVDTKVMLRVAIPGAITAFLGAVVLTSISLASAKAWMAGLLFFFGVVIFARFGFGLRLIPQPRRGNTARWLSPIGALGGFVDATGGGGWGPVCTPSLMTVTSHEPRKVVGTVNAAEFVVAASASLGFVFGVTTEEDIPWMAVLGLVIGGVLVAPFAARLAGRLPHAPMGTMVGGLILLVNGMTIFKAVGDLPGWFGWLLFVGTIAGTAVVAWFAWGREKEARAAADAAAVGEDAPVA